MLWKRVVSHALFYLLFTLLSIGRHPISLYGSSHHPPRAHASVPPPSPSH
jgi:hypothetical protein